MSRKIYFTVGPSQTFPTLEKHILKALKEDIPSLSHRGTKFNKLFENTTTNLRNLLNIPKTHEIYFVSSALESMERTLQSTVEKNSFHLITGSFGKAWYKYAKDLGKKAEFVDIIKSLVISNDSERSADSNLEISRSSRNDNKKLQNDSFLSTIKIPQEAELICITQNDTSTGISLPMEEIHSLKLHYPKKLVALDVVSSIPFVDLDYSKVDITFFSVQKGFGLPAGLAVIIVSPQALEKSRKLVSKGISIGSIHSFLNLSEKAKENLTPETPNVLNIYLLNQVLEDMTKLGIKKIREDTEKKAKLFYDFFEKSPKFKAFVKDKKYYSKTVIVVDTKSQTSMLKKRLSSKGIEIGAGYGDKSEVQMRIANFPSHTLADVKRLIKYLT